MRRSKLFLSLFFVGIVLSLFISISFFEKTSIKVSNDIPSLYTADELQSLQKARVLEVIDGDTIQVDLNGEKENVRYLGIDTPEIEHSLTGRTQQFGQNARELNKQLVESKEVFLLADIQDKDDYDRLLRYVFLDNGKMVNLIILRSGYAKVLFIKPNVRFSSILKDTESAAIQEKLGIWK